MTWVKAIPEVRNLVNWISLNIFYPTKIIGRSQQTDRVLIRISVSMLNKIDLEGADVEKSINDIKENFTKDILSMLIFDIS